MTRILAFAGSARSASLNKTLVRRAAKLAEELGAEVELLDLRDFEMPLYDGDLEEAEGVPDGARRLRERLLAADGLLLACPEYNGSITPLLKNAIDWTSRPDGDTPGLVGWRGKTATLLSASPGALGGLRGLVHVRAILGGIGVLVLPSQCAIGGAHKVFDDDGRLTDERLAGMLEGAVRQLVDTTSRLGSDG